MRDGTKLNSVLDRRCDGCGGIIDYGRYTLRGDKLIEALCRKCLGGDIVTGEFDPTRH